MIHNIFSHIIKHSSSFKLTHFSFFSSLHVSFYVFSLAQNALKFGFPEISARLWSRKLETPSILSFLFRWSINQDESTNYHKCLFLISFFNVGKGPSEVLRFTGSLLEHLSVISWLSLMVKVRRTKPGNWRTIVHKNYFFLNFICTYDTVDEKPGGRFALLSFQYKWG